MNKVMKAPEKIYLQVCGDCNANNCENCKFEDLEDSFKLGANWKEHQMIAKAIDGKVIANGMGNPILHLWDKGKHLIDKKVKIIVIEED